MSESWKIRLMRERIENENPERAADATAARFERAAIPTPNELIPPPGAPDWQRRVYRDAESLYRELVIAEPDGLNLTGLQAAGHLGQKRHQVAVKLLRESGTVVEGRGPSENAAKYRIFLRPVVK